MFRSLFLYFSNARWARTFITRFGFARRTARRFVAGETADEAIAVIRTLNAKGIRATVDLLGESVTTEAETQRAVEGYLLILDKIAQSNVCANVSLKLTQFGLDISSDLCERNVRRVVEKARATHNFVRIDMEGTPHTDRTIAIFCNLRKEFENVGLVLQAYLYRTEKDLLELTADGVRLRLCKGAYNEPPDKAFPQKADTDANYIKLMKLLMDRAPTVSPGGDGGRCPPLAALATHDEKMIAATLAYAAEQNTPHEYFEFQMLYGIRRERQEQLAAQGYAMRVYVPYGTEWFPYLMRRLAERPANVWFFVSSFFKR
jgi:proline dehydrogenase